MFQMKKMAAAVAIAAASMGGAQAATTLNAGDLAFTGWLQTSGVYGYSFTTFTDIAAGTNIFFTDENWKGALGTNGGWSNSTSTEGIYEWTVGSGGVSAGSQLFVSLYTAPVSTSTAYVPTGVYDSLTFTTGGTTPGSNVASAVQNGTTTILDGALTAAGGVATTSNTAIGSSDTFYIYQGGTAPGTTPTAGQTITVPSISTLIAVGAVTAGGATGDNVIGLGGANTATTTALDATGILQAADTALAKKGIVYEGPTDFSIGNTIEGITIVDNATSVAAAKKAVYDSADYQFAGGTAAFSLTPTATQTFTAINSTDFILAAVPEPSTYAMLLAGLGMLGLIARRRSV